MRVSSRLRRLRCCTPRACNAQATLARDCSERGRRGADVAHMGEPGVQGGRRIAVRHPAAHLPLPDVHAAATNRMQPATAHAIWDGGGRERDMEGM